METKLRLVIYIILALSITFIWGEGAVLAMSECDPTYVKQQGTLFTVLPTGTNDTVNLQCALDTAVDAGPGSIVKLLSGTYYIDQGIAVVNFDGTFTGAGKDDTYVQNIDVDPFPPHNVYPDLSVLFTFFQDENAVQNSILISDLTFRAIGSGIWGNFNEGLEVNTMDILVLHGKVTGIHDDQLSFLNTSLIRVGFEGQSGDWYGGTNVGHAAWVSGEIINEPCGINGDSICRNYVKPLSGTHIVQDCTFKNAWRSYGTSMLQDSLVKVEGSTFEDSSMADIFVRDFSNSTITIQRNAIHRAAGYGGLFLMNGIQAEFGLYLGPHGSLPSPSKVIISHNEISVMETADGIFIADYGVFQNQSTYEDVMISHNKIILDGTSYGGLYGFGVSGIAFMNNKITGTGAYGVYADGWDAPLSDWVLVGNNLETAYTFWPPIILGPLTSNVTIVGGNNINNVLDLGTDNNITGVNITRDSDLGKIVSDAVSDRPNWK